jgi:hypothetical protein
MQQRFNLCARIPMIAVDIAMPYCLYIIFSSNFPNNRLIPLSVAVLPPAIYGIVNIIRKRRIDYVGALVILVILVLVAATFVTGHHNA